MKNYSVNLSQDEENAPTKAGEKNNLGVNLTASFDDTGTYFLTALLPIFDLNTKIFISNTSDLNHIKAQYDSAYRIRIVTRNGDTGELQNNVLSATSLYIELFEEETELSNSELSTILHCKSLLVAKGLIDKANSL